MIGDAIRFVLTNLPTILFVLALIVPTLIGPRSAERYLDWQLLLPVGLGGVWAGLFHVFSPETAASFIGWQVSPFQFEMGITDIATGITAVIAFWRRLEFKAALVVFVSLLYAGLAIGHVKEIMVAGNYAPGNAGLLLAITIVTPFLVVWLLVIASRSGAKHEA